VPGGTKTKLGLWLWLCMVLGRGTRLWKLLGMIMGYIRHDKVYVNERGTRSWRSVATTN